MMRFYTIPPVFNLNLCLEGQDLFALAHLYYENEEYRNFFKVQKGKGRRITLDNSAAEKSLVTEDVLIWCCKDLLPDEVIAPDHLFDFKKTMFSLQSFIEKMIEEDLVNKVEILAVPQGADKDEWIICYKLMIMNPLVKTIGMSKLGIPHAWLGEAKDDQGIMEARHKCINYLLEKDWIEKPLHFLGMGSPLEMQKYKDLNNPLFRSTDSCFSIWSAMNNLDWSKGQFDRNATPKDYFDRIMTEEQIILAKSNINWFKNFLS